jgi:hypothetical protein
MSPMLYFLHQTTCKLAEAFRNFLPPAQQKIRLDNKETHSGEHLQGLME